jgi:hypothetical protein
MIGLWKHIDEGEPARKVSFLGKEAEISGERGGITRDIDDLFGFQSGHLI